MIHNILSALAEINSSQTLVESFKMLTEDDLVSFINDVDESPYSLKEWCETLAEFEKWGITNNRPLLLSAKIEYLCCCVQGVASDGRLLSLSTVWANYIKLYGVQ